MRVLDKLRPGTSHKLATRCNGARQSGPTAARPLGCLAFQVLHRPAEASQHGVRLMAKHGDLCVRAHRYVCQLLDIGLENAFIGRCSSWSLQMIPVKRYCNRLTSRILGFDADRPKSSPSPGKCGLDTIGGSPSIQLSRQLPIWHASGHKLVLSLFLRLPISLLNYFTA